MSIEDTTSSNYALDGLSLGGALWVNSPVDIVFRVELVTLLQLALARRGLPDGGRMTPFWATYLLFAAVFYEALLTYLPVSFSSYRFLAA